MRDKRDCIVHPFTHSGGIELIFNGSNLNSVQNPVLVIQDSDFEVNVRWATYMYMYVYLRIL